MQEEEEEEKKRLSHLCYLLLWKQGWKCAKYKRARRGELAAEQRCRDEEGVRMEIWWGGSRGQMREKHGEERGKTDREKRGNHCSVNGIQSNFLLLKKSFIYVDSLLVMYSSVTPPHNTHTWAHPHFLLSHPQCVCTCVLLLVCCASVYMMRLYCFFLQGGELVGSEAVLNCTDKINM